MRQFVLSIYFIFISISALFAQNIGGHEAISDSQVKPWNTDNKSDYEYVYHFGDSEWEYDVVIIITESSFHGFISRGEFNDAGTAWIKIYEPLTNVAINGNRFFCDQFQGQFAIYDDGNEKMKGLKMLNSQTHDLHKDYEFGRAYEFTGDFFSGKYPVASYRKLSPSNLDKRSKDELQIMRNEIFARYGYIFIPNGKMDTYFRAQGWYKPQHKNVDAFLTDLEKENIAKIKAAEAKK